MRTPFGTFIIIVIMILLDIYVFMAIKSVSQSASSRLKTIMYVLYWIFALLAISGFLVFVFTGPEFLPKKVRTYLFASVLAFVFGQLVSCIFFMVDDVRRLIQWLAGKAFFRNTEVSQMNGDGISRSVFLSWIGLAAGTTLF